MNAELLPLEVEVLEFILAGDDPRLWALGKQLAWCSVVSRQVNSDGFVTELRVPPSARYPGQPNLDLPDVFGDIEGLEGGAAFVLFIRDGGLDTLEGSTFDEPWPSDISSPTLRYLQEPRDLEMLKVL